MRRFLLITGLIICCSMVVSLPAAFAQVPDGDVAPLGVRDGVVTVGDALVCLRFALGLETPTAEDIIHADVAPLDLNGQPDPDGQINVGDALVILRKAVGLISWDTEPSGGVTYVNVQAETLIDATGDLSQTQVGSAGGTLSISDPEHPLNGLKIVVPPGAVNEDVTFSVAYGDIASISGLPDGTQARSQLIQISALGSDEWNEFAMFDLAVSVTLPLDNSSGDVLAYFHLNEDGSLEAVGFDQIDGNGAITFSTRTFADTASSVVVDEQTVALPANSNRSVVPSAFSLVPEAYAASAIFNGYVAIGITAQKFADWTNTSMTIDTGFRPSANGWYIPNYGSYYKQSRGGNCMGMVGFAKYYYKQSNSPALYSNYRDTEPTDTWLDDDTAIELASRMQNGLADIWNQIRTGELNKQVPSSAAVARSYVGALYVTGVPALLGIYQAQMVGGVIKYTGGHAISTYRVDIDVNGNFTFYIYDPNFPNKDNRRINYISGTGFKNYASGTDAGSSAFQYNIFKHFNYRVGMTDAALAALKRSADTGFSNSSVFPTLTVSSITGKTDSDDVLANTGTTLFGQDKYITTDNAIRIQGTVLGGLAQTAGSVVNNLRVLTPSGNYSSPVNNAAGSGDGKFDITIPLLPGENMVALLASKSSSFSHWAAFELMIVDSQATFQDLTVTLSWTRGQSDIDLYVKEPDAEGKTGDTVYYSHRQSASQTNPYLDFDNTDGFGPEHYIANEGMKTKYSNGTEAPNLYGDYTVGVHYYADHDDNYEETQSIPWNVHWRFLAYCEEPCDDPETNGFWEEGSRNGVLGTENSNADGDIFNGGPSWSSLWTIPYPQPDADEYIIPDSHEIQLP